MTGNGSFCVINNAESVFLQSTQAHACARNAGLIVEIKLTLQIKSLD